MLKTKLKMYRKLKGMTQQDLARALNVSLGTVGNWEIGNRTPDTDTLDKLADLFEVSIDDLLGREPHRTQIPVYGNVAAGIPIEAITDIEDYEEIDEALASGGEYIALRIHGDSMEPRMTNGDVVIVRLQPDVDSGDTAIVMTNGDNATCKKIKKMPGGILLISTNSAYEPMYYSAEQIASLPVRIIGKVVELRAKF